MLDIDQFRRHVVSPALKRINLWSLSAEQLIIGTAIQESRLKYLHQINGPALGLFQCEPATHSDIWDNYITFRPNLARSIERFTTEAYHSNIHQEMVFNLFYATMICRVHYLRVPEPLPEAGDTKGQAEYWKNHYNTELGKGTVLQYITHYNEAMNRQSSWYN